jgi:hypothetical protein
MRPMTRTRLGYVAAALLTIAAGLLWRRTDLGLSSFLTKYGGSVLWGGMVFLVLGALFPSAERKRVASAAAAVSAAVEFSQLLHIGWLDAFRRTTFGQLLLGRIFTWSDIAAYWIGIILTLAVAMLVARQRAERS